MAEVLDFDGLTRLALPTEKVLDGARELKSVVVLGYDADGEEYFASSIPDGGDILWLIERLKKRLIEVD